MSPRGLGSSILTVSAALLMGLAPGCARQGAPPGGDRDILPPVVMATRPDTFESVDVVDDPIRIVFNERISERPTTGTLNDAVLVSPRTGDVRVKHKRDALEVDLSGGVRPGLVYRVTVLPVIQDMFNNPMGRSFEFVFSTGGEITPTAVAGLVLDRLTGQPVADARVIAREVGGDTAVVYTSRTDTSGIYTLRYMPPGDYELVAFTDRDRNFRPGSFEVQGRRVIELTDTVLSDLVILEPDTLPARLASVEPTDSAVLTLTFDDHLEPTMDPSEVRVTLEPDSTAPADAPAPPEVAGVFHPWAWEARMDSIAAAADTSEADEDADEAPVGRAGEGLLDGELPTRELLVLLERSLPEGVPYRLTVEGVVNVAGLGGGGGNRIVIREQPVRPAAPDSAAADTLDVSPDTLDVPPDTLEAVPDTAAAPPDTLGAPPDTAAAPPDTTAVPDTAASPPDTLGVVSSVRRSGRSLRSRSPPRSRSPLHPLPPRR